MGLDLCRMVHAAECSVADDLAAQGLGDNPKRHDVAAASPAFPG
jgi:hypothetical protein